MSRYLVTGGCGFIGSHLTDALIAQGHAVRIVDNLSSGNPRHLHPAAELMVGDIADALTLREAMRGVDGCFHLAAVASVARCNEAWLDTHRSNLVGHGGACSRRRRALRDAGLPSSTPPRPRSTATRRRCRSTRA